MTLIPACCLPSFLPSFLPSINPSILPSFLPSIHQSFLPSFHQSFLLNFPSLVSYFFASFFPAYSLINSCLHLPLLRSYKYPIRGAIVTPSFSLALVTLFKSKRTPLLCSPVCMRHCQKATYTTYYYFREINIFDRPQPPLLGGRRTSEANHSWPTKPLGSSSKHQPRAANRTSWCHQKPAFVIWLLPLSCRRIMCEAVPLG